MKQNYDFRFNMPTPSDKAIEGHKDFDALMKEFEKTTTTASPAQTRPIYITWMARAAGVAILIGGLAWVFSINSEKSIETRTIKHFASQEYVNPPIKGLRDAPTEAKLVAEKGGAIKSKSGSTYQIAANSLQTQDGQPVTGEVTIKYREMHDYVDFFLSGIPMEYDSAGTKYQLESAGMVEIYAEQNGEKLAISPERPIQVELISKLPLKKSEVVPKFNIYQLDIPERNWNFRDVDNVQLVKREEGNKGSEKEILKSIAKKERTAIASIESEFPEPKSPLKPQKANGNDFVFNLDFQGEQILSSESVSADESKRLFEKYQDAMWQVKLGTGVAASDLNQAWDNAQIKPLSNIDFELSLIKDGKPLKVIVNPVMSGEEYQNALEEYQGLLAEYSKELKARNGKVSSAIADVKDKFSNQRNSALANLEAVVDDAYYPATVINRFAVTDFGIWNCDRPYLPKGEKIAGSFVDDKNNKFDDHTAFLVDRNRNTVIRYYATEGTKVKVNEKSDNLLWIVTNDEKIAVFRPEDFAKLEESNLEKTFVLDVIDAPLASEADIREILAF